MLLMLKFSTFSSVSLAFVMIFHLPVFWWDWEHHYCVNLAPMGLAMVFFWCEACEIIFHAHRKTFLTCNNLPFFFFFFFFVTPRLLQKCVIRHHQSYKLTAKIYIFNDNTSDLLTKILQNI